jgi:phosphoribosylcarboxyaminoimidazole (NCAIR) mutase
MSLLTDLMGLGMPGELAGTLSSQTISSATALSSSGTLTASGTTISDALALTSFVNLVGTAALNSGVKLPIDVPIGTCVYIANNGANAVRVYAQSSQTINTSIAGATGTSVATTQAVQCVRQSSTNWIALVHTKAT